MSERAWKSFRCGLAIAACGLMLGGCGGDDETTTQPGATESQDSTAMSETEFIAEADAICAELNEQSDSLQDAETLDQLAADAEAAQELAVDGLARLRELEPPTSELQAGFDQFLTAVEEQAEVISQVGEAAAAGDPSAIQELTPQLEAVQQRKGDAATDIGFSECGIG